MKILSIDSSGMPASCAVCEDDRLLAEYTVHFKRTHSQTLVPMLDEICTMLELDPDCVDVVAVAGGRDPLPDSGLVRPRQRGSGLRWISL